MIDYVWSISIYIYVNKCIPVNTIKIIFQLYIVSFFI